MKIKCFRKFDVYDDIHYNAKVINKELNKSEWNGRFQIAWDESEGYCTGVIGDFLVNLRVIDKKTRLYQDFLMNANKFCNQDYMRGVVISFMELVLHQYPQLYYDATNYRHVKW